MTEAAKMNALGDARGDATMRLRVYRKDGTVEHHEGKQVEIQLTPELQALIDEYKTTVARARELEGLIATKLMGG